MKMLVLIDGRGFYTNIFSGVLWEQNDLMLEDVDRIEVIRGPGGTMWAANAVNGVINVIAKKAYFSKAVSTEKIESILKDQSSLFQLPVVSGTQVDLK